MHRLLSSREGGPFVGGGLRERSLAELVESELFGHAPGRVHRSADRDAQGSGSCHPRMAGTLFLDEIGELPPELQPKLLRVLERREVKRLGETDAIDVDVRIVAATHRDLEAMVESGEFREDLYYRLSEIVLRLPPLRERTEDIPGLAARMLKAAAPDRALALGADAAAELSRMPFKGNVRELRNVLRRAAALTEGDVIDSHALRSLDQLYGRPQVTTPSPGDPVGVAVAGHLPIKQAREAWVAKLEKQYMVQIKAKYGADLDAAAGHMGILRKSVLRLLRLHGLED